MSNTVQLQAFQSFFSFLQADLCLCVLFQLALSPSPRTPSEPIPVQNTQQLTLKVEGVVQHGSTPGLFRKIQSVCLNVTSVLQSKTGPDYKVCSVVYCYYTIYRILSDMCPCSVHNSMFLPVVLF